MGSRFTVAFACLSGALLCLEGVSWLTHRVEPGPDRFLWIGLFTQGLWIFAALGGATLLGGGGWTALRERLGLGRGRLSAGAVGLLTLGFVLFSTGLYQILGELALRDTGALGQIDRAVDEASSRAPSFALALLALGVGPGLAEELLFRGLLQRWLTARLGAALAIAATAGLFALAHADRVQSIAVLPMGVYLGLVAHWTGGVRASMACHMLNNCLGVAFAGGLVGLEWPGGMPLAAATVAIGAGLALGVGWRRAVGNARDVEDGCDSPPGDASQRHQAQSADRRL